MKTAAVLALLISVEAAAQEMPRFDVEKACDEMARISGPRSEFLYNGCFNQEQTAYNALKPVWGGLPAAVRATCEEMTRLAGQTYFLLKGCVDQEMSAREANKDREFKF